MLDKGPHQTIQRDWGRVHYKICGVKGHWVQVLHEVRAVDVQKDPREMYDAIIVLSKKALQGPWHILVFLQRELQSGAKAITSG